MVTQALAFLIAVALAGCSAAPRPSPACHDSISGKMPCAPCDGRSEMSAEDAGSSAMLAHVALLEREVTQRALSVGALTPGSEAYEDARAVPIDTRYFRSDVTTEDVDGYSGGQPDPNAPHHVLFVLTTVGYSGRDRVHVRVDQMMPSGTPAQFHREVTTFYCVVVGADGIADVVPLWFY